MASKKSNFLSVKPNKFEKRESFSVASDTDSQIEVKSQKQRDALQKLASSFAAKTKQKKNEVINKDSWKSLIQNLLDSQRGKLPLLLAVESGNQSMVRELLSAQTAEQLKVSNLLLLVESFALYLLILASNVIKKHLNFGEHLKSTEFQELGFLY